MNAVRIYELHWTECPHRMFSSVFGADRAFCEAETESRGVAGVVLPREEGDD